MEQALPWCSAPLVQTFHGVSIEFGVSVILRAQTSDNWQIACSKNKTFGAVVIEEIDQANPTKETTDAKPLVVLRAAWIALPQNCVLMRSVADLHNAASRPTIALRRV